MEPHRRIGGLRTLLPFEVELCESIGISDKEYFEFLDLVDAKPVEADIVMMPQAAGAFALYSGTFAAGNFALTWLGQVAVSVALAAASYLLTPKPKDQSQGPRLDIGGVQGRSRFNPSNGFDSLQDLASLGSFIPLVYAAKGIRVKSQLLWSQIRATQYGQEINAICLFSNGELGSKPKFESLALGETFLTNLPKTKLQVYFSRGESDNNRLNFSDKYSEGIALDTNNYRYRGSREYSTTDPFSVKTFLQRFVGDIPQFNYLPCFSSTKTPSASSFGLFSPMPNGNAYKLNWELILLMKDGDDGVKRDQRIKMGKLAHYYPRYVGIMASADSTHYPGAFNGLTLSPSQVQAAIDANGPLLVNYRLYHDDNEAAWIDQSITNVDQEKKWTKFSPWGSSDAKAVADTTREGVDDAIKVGDQYMVGSTLMTAVSEDDGRVWVSGAEGFEKAIQLKADEGGYLEFRNTDGTAKPYESLIVQKVKLATFTNTRQSNITEIGIKSTVWRRINSFPNVNEMPSQDRLRSYEKNNGSIQLGSVSKHVRRASFFKLQAKKINTTFPFVDISNDIMCVEGSMPTAQYNTIHIHHDYTSQYEFRFMPVAGNVVLNHHTPREIHVLHYTGQLQSNRNNNLGLAISYHANVKQLPALSDIDEGNNFTNNSEWNRGGLGIAFDEDGEIVLGAPVDSFQVENITSLGSNNFTPPRFIDRQEIFSPDFKTTYTGIGPLNANGTWTNVTQRNLKGTPKYGNAYYSPRFHGIAATATPFGINNAQWRWTFYGGGQLLPTGSLASIDLSFGSYPDWTKSVEEVDENGFGTGRSHRFRVAYNPTVLGGKEDWRETVNGTYYFAVWIQRTDRVDPTETINLRTTNSTKGVGEGLKVNVTTKTDGVTTYKTVQLAEAGDGYFDGDTVTVDSESPTISLKITGKEKPPSLPPAGALHGDWSGDGTRDYYLDYWAIQKHNNNNVVADYFLYSAESSSHENGAEHEVAFINEIVHNTTSDGTINYEKLAIGGIRVGATGSIDSFNSFSAFIEQGIKVDRLVTDANVEIPTQNNLIASTDNFVEIAHDLLTNKEYGAGDLVGHDGVDRQNMIKGAQYCKANGFHWNGIIDNKFNLREFIFEHAGYNFLDFSILGGRFCLKPSFPINADYTINYNATIDNNGVEIKALFTDGNMRKIKVTMLTPEERKMFKATVMYRDDKLNSNGVAAFPETIAKTYAYNKDYPFTTTAEFLAEAPNLPEEVFDLSNWCTSLDHAKTFAAIALATRKDVDHGIVFETVPSSVLGLIAGDYIRIVTESTHTSRFNNGSIDSDGKVISRSTISGSINVYVWSPGTLGGITKADFTVDSNGVNSKGLKNKLFAQVDTTEEDRIYKVESITYGEEGFIQISASHVPVTSDKTLAVLKYVNPKNKTVFDAFFPELLM